jgi:hypothetical protein
MLNLNKRVALSLTSAALVLTCAGTSFAAKPDDKQADATASDKSIPAPTIDTNEDGKPDAWDRDANGTPDAWDINGDGKPDAVDDNGDGKPDDGNTAATPKPEGETPR